MDLSCPFEPSNGTATSKHEKTRIRAHASSSLFFDTLDHSTKCTHTQSTSLISFGSTLLRSAHNDDIDRMEAMVSVVACSFDEASTSQQKWTTHDFSKAKNTILEGRLNACMWGGTLKLNVKDSLKFSGAVCVSRNPPEPTATAVMEALINSSGAP